MKKFILRLLINSAALYVALVVLNGRGVATQDGSLFALLGLALIFGLVNSVIRPIAMLLGCPLMILTLGLGTLIVNALMFYLAGLIGTWFGIGFSVEGFLPALFGSIIVSIVSLVLSSVLKDELK
jgi:putative membrane protein